MASGGSERSDMLHPSLSSMLPMLPTPNLDCRCKQSKKRPYQTFAFKQMEKGHFEKLPPHDCSVRWHVPCVPALLTAQLKLPPWHATQYGAAHWDLATVGKYSRGRTERPLFVCVCVSVCVCVCASDCSTRPWRQVRLSHSYTG